MIVYTAYFLKVVSEGQTFETTEQVTQKGHFAHSIRNHRGCVQTHVPLRVSIFVVLTSQRHTKWHVKRCIVNALPKVVGFLRVLRFPPAGKVDMVGQLYGPTVIGSRCCGDPALVAKLNKIKNFQAR